LKKLKISRLLFGLRCTQYVQILEVRLQLCNPWMVSLSTCATSLSWICCFCTEWRWNKRCKD